jgi:D-alanyl-D-alanine carboxypeptidase/D-alanyl-D-alanine-endopeptidase (penicillin-binding protein 4)
MSWSRVFTSVLLLASGAALATLFFLTLGPEPAVERRIPSEASREAPEGKAREHGVQSSFNDWLADPALAGASVGFCLLNENGGIEFASPLAWNALCPASSLKTVTTAAALELLGPEFRFETRLSGTSALGKNGVLDGDLVCFGHGDPTLASSDLETLADEWVNAGLKQLNGKVLVTDSDNSAPPVSDHWNWGDIGNAYGVGAFRLNVDHNRISVRFDPGQQEGSPATIVEKPATTVDTRWLNQVVTGPSGSGDQVVIYSEPFGRRITLRGSVPLGEAGFRVSGALPDPPARAVEIVKARLQRAGVRILGREATGVKKTLGFVASHQSSPLAEIIDHLHKVSDNLEAQCLFFAIGDKVGADPSTALRRHWESRVVEFKGLRLLDGSGLARANMIRPLDLAKVNHLARRGPHGERFRQSLTAYLDGRVRSKLGAMSGVKADVGFITMADGREFTFCLMANGLNPELNFWPLRDKLLLQVATGSADR